ncbi:OmpH family outer membrane protein [Parabacteroides sp. 52]|uniref:OmpH family outer membrane protein n=1 Tax=unclassified Parabacteroides TaxID=2649774 RepID=UPI0013D57A80|nr:MULTISPECIES: OmpH family outer membrane protein [unclassified Parabacteroides]MDH6535479.1 outer membrane protein [Parabacteroides sp. PM5-20]NDV55941.1 OmpH family outer membrane protein [Parabacteroides sp. 52]
MKNINYVINGVLAVAIIILFVMQFSNKKETTVTKAFAQGDEATAILPIAYVNIDSLLMNYNYAKDLYEIQMKSQENARLNLSQKMRDLEKDAVEFQRKVDNNAFLSRERAEQERQRLVKKNEDIQELDAKLSQELMTEQQQMNEVLRDTVISQLKAFNVDRGYQIILSNTGGDNVLLSNDAYNITEELLEVLNKNYSPANK